MPIEKIADFELDTDARQLRLGGEEISMQPKVFDLLCHLVAHQDRVVDKDELLEKFWPGVIVTDASLQRAISLARSALRTGGLENSIRTYSRRGYRFVPPEQVPSLPGVTEQRGDRLARAYSLVDTHRWFEAIQCFEQADGEQTLSIGDLEQWAFAAQCAGRLMDAIDPLERAAAAYSALNEPEAAARANLLLARIQLEAQETAIARGCLARAESLLQNRPLCEQHGHLEWVTARYCCYVGDLQATLKHAEAAIKIGRQLDDSDLLTIGTLYYGIAIQATGETQRGLQKQDEAAAAVLAGDVSPLIGGIVYCGLIAGCCNTGDWPRAGQWTTSFRRWCNRMQLSTFAGSCILHRAEVYAACGDIHSARKELDDGAESLKRSAPWAIGDAYRVMGDIHLLRGEFSESEQAYRQAYEHGWDPYPGYALLQFYRGQADAALRGLQRACEATHWVAGERRGHYLAYLVIIAALSGELELAQKTLLELDNNPGMWEAGSVNAFVLRARGELSLANGETEAAIQQFKEAMEKLKQLELPIEAAITRMSLARALLQNHDREGAEMELNAARRVFAESQAYFYAQRCEELL
jgi:DNA-binding winged helix-turn-helix (wHTH) protein